jgi:hypothetical protein
MGTSCETSLTDLGATADARMTVDGGMTSGSAILSSASADFTDADVGKAIVVAGAGAAGGKLKTTILSRESSTQVTLAANAAATIADTGVALGTDCSAFLLAGLDAMDEALGGTLVVDGYFLLTEPVAKTFFSTQTSTGVRIVGTGSNSGFLVAVDPNETAISLGGAVIDMALLGFIGVKGAVDAGRVLYFTDATVILQQCAFTGLLTSDQCVRHTFCWFYSRLNGWGGSFPSGVGIAAPSVQRTVLYGDDWFSFMDEDSQFVDYGYFQGLLLSKSGVGAAAAWVGVGAPTDNYSGSAMRAASIARFFNTRTDEGSLKGIWVEPGAGGQHMSVEMLGSRHNVIDVAEGSALYINGVRDVRVDRCMFGLAPTNGTVFGEFVDCGRVTINSVSLLQGVNRIIATNVDALVVRGTEIASWTLTGTNYYPQALGLDGLSLVKNGAISDSDFPVAPAIGVQALDRANGRLYVRARGDWIYFNMDGGSLLGPELVINGTGASTAGWTSGNGGTLSVAGGNLRITNTAIYGYATQSIAVEIGKEYVFSATGVSGSRMIRLGRSPSDSAYANSVDGSLAGVHFTPTTASVSVTLIVNSEAIGAVAQFDNISLRAA